MVFCGQCGLHIPPGTTRCPRCGAVVDTVDTNMTIDELHADDATIASLSYPMHNPPQGGFPQSGAPSMPGNPQKLVLRPDDDGIAEANVPTSRVNAPIYGNYPTQSSGGTPYPGYEPQSGTQYPAQRASNPEYAPYPTYPDYPPENEPVRERSRGRIASLVIILLGLVLLLGALSLFAYLRFGAGHGFNAGGATNTPTTTSNGGNTPTASPEQQAQAVVTQYYDDVNNKNYEAAYNLWQDGSKPAPTLAAFIKGYQYTQHDDLAVTKTAQLNDGTVQVSITIVATEQTTTGGSQQSTYKGYYIVGQQSGTWKIQSGQLSKM